MTPASLGDGIKKLRIELRFGEDSGDVLGADLIGQFGNILRARLFSFRLQHEAHDLESIACREVGIRVMEGDELAALRRYCLDGSSGLLVERVKLREVGGGVRAVHVGPVGIDRDEAISDPLHVVHAVLDVQPQVRDCSPRPLRRCRRG